MSGKSNDDMQLWYQNRVTLHLFWFITVCFHRGGTWWREFFHSFPIIPMSIKKFKWWFTLSRSIIYSFFHYKFFKKDENVNLLNLQNFNKVCCMRPISNGFPKLIWNAFQGTSSTLFILLPRFIQIFGNRRQKFTILPDPNTIRHVAYIDKILIYSSVNRSFIIVI